MDYSTLDKIDKKITELLELCRENGYKVFVGVTRFSEQTELIMRSEDSYAFVHWLFDMVLHEQSIKEDIDFEKLLKHFTQKAGEASEKNQKAMKEMLNEYNKEDK